MFECDLNFSAFNLTLTTAIYFENVYDNGKSIYLLSSEKQLLTLVKRALIAIKIVLFSINVASVFLIKPNSIVS